MDYNVENPLDRDLQRKLLIKLRDEYPGRITWNDEDAKRVANLLYLEEHGLCQTAKIFADGKFHVPNAAITARGLDFLADDGGLSTILGVLTVRLEVNSVKDLLEARIEEASITTEEKASLRQHLRRLSGVVLQDLTRELIRRGVQNLSDVGPLLRRFVDL